MIQILYVSIPMAASTVNVNQDIGEMGSIVKVWYMQYLIEIYANVFNDTGISLFMSISLKSSLS